MGYEGIASILSRSREDGGPPETKLNARESQRGPLSLCATIHNHIHNDDVIPNRCEAPVRNLLWSRASAVPNEKLYYVYILASRSRVIYVGMTAFLMSRVLNHRAGEGGTFTQKYRIHRLVCYEIFHSVAAAIARETEIKKWRREKKVALIVQKNPTWEDLAAEWGRPFAMTNRGKAGSSPPLRAGSE
jgi:putative endonuclease